jgi:DNA-binding NtrC family response regulator
MSYGWPGNVRELANVIERAVALSDHDTIVAEDLELAEDGGVAALLADGVAQSFTLEQIERAYVRRVVDAHGGNRAAAARVLGINRRTLYRKLEPS